MAWYTKRNFNGGTVLLEQNITDNNELESFNSENFKELAKEYPNSENGKVYLIKYFVDDEAYYQLGGEGKLEALSRPAGRTAATGVDVSEALFSQKTAKGKRDIIYQEIEKDLLKGKHQQKGELRDKKTFTELLEKKDVKGMFKFLDESLKEFHDSEAYKKYLGVMAQFPHYSARNIYLLYKQDPKLRAVQSVGAWKKFDPKAYPKKGSKALRIVAPVPHKKFDEKGQPLLDKNGKEVIYHTYRMIPVFDLHQMVLTKDFPEPLKELSGQVNGYSQLYRAIKHSSEIPIVFKEPALLEKGANGVYLPEKKMIILKSGMDEKMTIKTLLHEVTHAQLHTTSTSKFGSPEYAKHEFEAESVAYVMSQHYGLNTQDYSFPYLADWGKEMTSEKLKESMIVIQNQTKTMITTIDQTLEKIKNKSLDASPITKKLEAVQNKEISQVVSPQSSKNEVNSQEKKLISSSIN